jgi:hypothetical protein
MSDRPATGTRTAPTPEPASPELASNEPSAGDARRSRARGGRRWWIIGIVISVLIVVVLAPRASSDPDGLERVAEDTGFIGQAENLVAGLLGDYAIPGIDDPAVSTVLSGLLGLAIILGLVFLLGRVLARRRA